MPNLSMIWGKQKETTIIESWPAQWAGKWIEYKLRDRLEMKKIA